MKIVFKAISAALVAFILLFVARFALDVSAFGAGKTQFLYLILGLDDAASNSDAILIASYNSKDNTASVVQLPRDTYCASTSKSSLNKINSVYASYIASGFSDGVSLQKTADFIANKLGVCFDGYLSFTLDDLIKLVDAFNGVRINLPHDVVFYDKHGNPVRTFFAGKNILTGKDAAFFVRYRAGYVNGDLGRLDAQKVFMNALFNTAVHNTGIDELFDITKIFSDSVVTNIRLREILGMVLKHSSKFKDAEVAYLTMPGKPVRDENGVWYYVLNRKASVSVLQKHMNSDGKTFDTNQDFSDKTKPGFFEIYFSESIHWEEYRST